MRGNRRYSSPFFVLVLYNPLTVGKLAQVRPDQIGLWHEL